MIVIAAAAAIWWCAAVSLLLLSLLGSFLQPILQRRRATRRDQPPVALILPIKMLDPGFERALGSAFTQTYAAVTVFVAAADVNAPAMTKAKALVHGLGADGSCRFVHAPPRGAASPKLDVLSASLDLVTQDVVMTKDSNVTLAPGDINAFVASLTPEVGLVCAVPVAVRADGLSGQIEAMLINGHARLLLTASSLGIGFGVGKVMLFRRSDYLRAGGFEALAHTIAEDTAMCRAMATLGLKTRFAHVTVAQEIGRRTWREIYLRQARWAVIRRRQEPISFPLEPLSNVLPAVVAGAIAAPLIGMSMFGAATATLLGWCLLELGGTALKGWELKPAAPLALIGRDFLALSSWLRAWLRQDVVWADASFDIAAEPNVRRGRRLS